MGVNHLSRPKNVVNRVAHAGIQMMDDDQNLEKEINPASGFIIIVDIRRIRSENSEQR